MGRYRNKTIYGLNITLPRVCVVRVKSRQKVYMKIYTIGTLLTYFFAKKPIRVLANVLASATCQHAFRDLQIMTLPTCGTKFFRKKTPICYKEVHPLHQINKPIRYSHQEAKTNFPRHYGYEIFQEFITMLSVIEGLEI